MFSTFDLGSTFDCDDRSIRSIENRSEGIEAKATFSTLLIVSSRWLDFVVMAYFICPYSFSFRPPMIQNRRLIPIAVSYLFVVAYVAYVYVTRWVLWPSGARENYSVYRSRIGMRGRFNWYHFRSP